MGDISANYYFYSLIVSKSTFRASTEPTIITEANRLWLMRYSLISWHSWECQIPIVNDWQFDLIAISNILLCLDRKRVELLYVSDRKSEIAIETMCFFCMSSYQYYSTASISKAKRIGETNMTLKRRMCIVNGTLHACKKRTIYASNGITAQSEKKSVQSFSFSHHNNPFLLELPCNIFPDSKQPKFCVKTCSNTHISSI